MKPHRRRSVVVFLVHRDVLRRKPLNVFFYIHLLHFSCRRATKTTTTSGAEEEEENDRKSRGENNWANERIPIRAMRRNVIFPATHTAVVMNKKNRRRIRRSQRKEKCFSLLSFGLARARSARIFPHRLFENSLFPYFFCVDKTVRQMRRRLPLPLFLAFFANALRKNINIFLRLAWTGCLFRSPALCAIVQSPKTDVHLISRLARRLFPSELSSTRDRNTFLSFFSIIKIDTLRVNFLCSMLRHLWNDIQPPLCARQNYRTILFFVSKFTSSVAGRHMQLPYRL